MNTAPTENNLKTVLELDLASYNDIARALEENLDVYAVKAFEDQVQSFVDCGLTQVGLKREDVVLGTAGDNAILVFDDPAVMHRFAEAVQHAVNSHNLQKTVASAKRWFRMGAATGPVLLLHADRRIVGTTVARAVRLEAAAENGQMLIDVATYNSLPDSVKEQYGDEEVISGKRDERFIARRCTLVPAVPFTLTIPPKSRWRRRLIPLIVLLTLSVAILASTVGFMRRDRQNDSTTLPNHEHGAIADLTLLGKWEQLAWDGSKWVRLSIVTVTRDASSLQITATNQDDQSKQFQILSIKHQSFDGSKWKFISYYGDDTRGYFTFDRISDGLFQGTLTVDAKDEPEYRHRLFKIE